eukprot:scaffold1172_cov115-Cylindrotheca_fusiformis.AAC.16
MTLRLSATSSSSSGGSKPFLDRLIEDGRLSLDQKMAAVKTASLLIANTIDPTKSQDPKYRKLKLGNSKLRERIFCLPSMMELLQYVGFEHRSDGEEKCLVMRDGREQVCKRCLVDLHVAQERLALVSNPTTSAPPLVEEKLSEKQKARRIREENERQEKQAAKENRKRNLAMLREDKCARQSDPNWKPKVSAACAKTGSGISTFRDKYGE